MPCAIRANARTRGSDRKDRGRCGAGLDAAGGADAGARRGVCGRASGRAGAHGPGRYRQRRAAVHEGQCRGDPGAGRGGFTVGHCGLRQFEQPCSGTANATEATLDDRSDALPATAYGRSKRVAEEHVAALAAKGVFAVSLRPPLVAGAEARGNWALLQRLAPRGSPAFREHRQSAKLRRGRHAVRGDFGTVSRSWDPRLSGNYCIADEERLSLPEVVRELRRGMGLPPRLFACPPAIFAALGQLSGRRRQLAGLTGNLRVDASRFFSTFAFKPATPIREAIRIRRRLCNRAADRRAVAQATLLPYLSRS